MVSRTITHAAQGDRALCGIKSGVLVDADSFDVTCVRCTARLEQGDAYKSKTPAQTPLMRVFGRRVAFQRRAAGLTQQQLADKVKLSRASIANMETGRQGDVGLSTLFALADAFGIAPVDLIPARLIIKAAA